MEAEKTYVRGVGIVLERQFNGSMELIALRENDDPHPQWRFATLKMKSVLPESMPQMLQMLAAEIRRHIDTIVVAVPTGIVANHFRPAENVRDFAEMVAAYRAERLIK